MTEDPSNREGYLAMVEFLNRYYDRAAGAIYEVLLSDIEIKSDGEPGDPAMWSDWLDALEVVRQAKPPDEA